MTSLQVRDRGLVPGSGITAQQQMEAKDRRFVLERRLAAVEYHLGIREAISSTRPIV